MCYFLNVLFQGQRVNVCQWMLGCKTMTRRNTGCMNNSKWLSFITSFLSSSGCNVTSNNTHCPYMPVCYLSGTSYILKYDIRPSESYFFLTDKLSIILWRIFHKSILIFSVTNRVIIIFYRATSFSPDCGPLLGNYTRIQKCLLCIFEGKCIQNTCAFIALSSLWHGSVFYIHGSVHSNTVLIRCNSMEVFIYCKITLHVLGVQHTHHQEYLKL